MTSDTTYTPVGGADSIPQQTSPQVSSQGSSTRTSPPGRFTPDLDSEDEEGPYILAGAGEDGYELAELGSRGTSKDANTARTAREEEDGLDSDDEHETWVDRSRRTSVQSFQLYTPDEERAVRRKLDTHLVLFVAL
jgi:hypothetical protein